MGDTTSGKDMAQELADFCNGVSKKEAEAFVEQLTRFEHRTLQQKAMGLFVACIERWAADCDRGCYDPRNEAAVRLARRFVQGTGDKYDRALPFIWGNFWNDS